MTQACDTKTAAAIAGLSRPMVDQLIHRGYFHPSQAEVPNGLGRRFTPRDVFTLAILADLMRLGLSAEQAGDFAPSKTLRHDQVAVLAIWRDQQFALHSKTVTLEEAAHLMASDEARGLVTMNLNQVERRVLAGLEAAHV